MSFDYDEATDEVERGRQVADGTWSPDWVAFAVSPSAHSLYTKFRMRLNRKRRDRKVWPGRASLAVMHGYATSDPITPLLKELVDVGAITIRRERMPRRNVYVVHDLPPSIGEAQRDGIAGYSGPMTVEEWDDDAGNRLAIAAIKRAEKVKRDRAKEKAKEKAQAKKAGKPGHRQLSLDTPDQGYQDESGQAPRADTADRRYLDTAADGYPDTANGRDLDTAAQGCHSSREPLGNEPPPPRPPAGTTASTVAGPKPQEDGGGGAPSPEQLQVAAAVVEAVQVLCGVDAPMRVKGNQARQLTSQVARRLAQGWPRDLLVDELAGFGTLATVDSVYAALKWRCGELGDAPAAPAAVDDPPPPSEERGRCGTCKGTRFAGEVEVKLPGIYGGVSTTDVRPVPCPDCNPRRRPGKVEQIIASAVTV